MFGSDMDRQKGAELIQDEAKKISAMFLSLSHTTNPKVRTMSSTWVIVQSIGNLFTEGLGAVFKGIK